MARRAARLRIDQVRAQLPGEGHGALRPKNEPGPPTSGHLEFKEFNGADVTVRGWPKLPNPTAQDNWIRDFSDHGLIYFEVQKV
jgi:hypothetical protein